MEINGTNPFIIENDMETVEVPLEYLRNALWYYENYYILLDLVEEKEVITMDLATKYKELLEDSKAIIAHSNELIERLQDAESSLSLWRGIAVGSITANVVLITFLIIGG